MKNIAKKIIKQIPINFTQNQRYDAQTIKVINKVCSSTSNCIDIGAHKGEVLDKILAAAPEGHHFAFEPIPALFQQMELRYKDMENVHLSNLALSSKKGEASFNYVVTNPSYSGLIKRKYDHKDEKDELITVQTDLLDNVLPAEHKIDLMKIDVEGGELLVLEGARKTITQHKPVIIFEHGLGASDFYGATPEKVFNLLNECGLKVSLMKSWLAGKPAFTLAEFTATYHSNKDYYFIAYP